MFFYFINGRNLAILPLDSANMTSITNAYIIWWRNLGRAKRIIHHDRQIYTQFVVNFVVLLLPHR